MRSKHPESFDKRERRLIEELYPSLRSFASAVRLPGEDGNDLVQEAFLRTIRSKDSLTALDNPGAYLRRTIVNLARDHQRSEARRRTAWSKMGSPSQDLPQYSWELEELRLVSPKCRAVLYLRIVEGWPYADIGEMLGCTQISARVAASGGSGSWKRSFRRRHEMRRLEDALHDLAEQDERLPTSELITRIERGLSSEGVLTVATMDGRSAMDAQENTRQDRRRIPMMVAAGAALLVLVVVGLPILFFGGRDSIVIDQPTTAVAPVVTTLPPSPVSPLTVPSTTAPLAPPVTEAVTEGPWQQVGVDVMEPIVGILDMEAVGSGLVAVGFDPGADFRQDGVIFTSDDGVAWTRLAENDPALTTGTVLIYSIVEGGPGLVAVGMSCPDDGFPCEDGPFPTVWSSVDGTTWNRSPVGVSNGSMEDVVATDNGLVAAGLVWELDDDDVVSNRPTIWTSPDGANWSQAWQGDPVQRTDGPQPGGYIGMLAVNPDGLIIAVGTAEDGVGEVVVAVWISTNGQDWERVETDSAAFTATTGLSGVIPLLDPLDATWGPTGFVVVGVEASEGESSSASGFNVAIWRSPDGRAWTRLDTTDQDFGTTGSLASIAALGSGYVAAGPDLGPFEGPVTVWTSPDGSRWIQVSEVDGEYAQAIVVIDNATFIAGATYANDDNHAAVWHGPVLDPLEPLTGG